MRRTLGTNLRNAIITAAWQLARSAHSTVERRRGLITSLPVNDKDTVAIIMAGTSVKVRESNSLMYSVPQDTDARCTDVGEKAATVRQPGTNTTAMQ